MAYKSYRKKGASAYGKYKKRSYANKAGVSKGGVMSKITHGTSALAKIAATTAGLVKSVQFIKGIINSEKKHVEQKLWSDGLPIGQILGNTDLGWGLTDITPLINQGVDAASRTGDSVKLSSMRLRMHFIQQKNLQTRAKYRVQIFRVKGSPVDVTTPSSVPIVMSRIYEASPLTGLTDYGAVRNPDFYNEFQLIASKSLFIGPENFSSANAPEQGMLQFNLKLDHHVRWDQVTQELANGQFLIAITADTGNASSTVTSTTPNINNTLTLTGASLTGYLQYYYFDN